MRRVILTIMAGMACLLSLDAGRVRAEDAARIITSRDRFTIPFRYDQELLSRLQAREVVLFVSVDEGRSWNEAGKQPIDRQNFLFEPTADGEYWFSVAIRDAENRLHPNPRQSPPGLKVVVDRKLPELSLQLIREDENRVRLTWKIKDPHADVDTLLLEFRNRPEDDWKMVYIAKALSGQTSWKTESDQLPEVRGQVFDTAGNVAQNQVTLEPKVAEPLLVEKAPQVETVTAYESSVMNHPPLTSSDMPLIMPGNPGKSSATSVPVIQPAPVLQAPVIQEQEMAPLPVVNAPVLESLPSLPAAEVPPPAFGPTPGAPTLTTPIPDVGMPRQYSQPRDYPYQRAQRDQAAQRTRFVNGHQFHMDYQVAGVGPSGVGAVELFITQDNGLQWWRYGVDPDLKSPMDVTVPNDGRYGFHFRIHSGVGNSDPPPQSGQAPQVDVIVDSQPPQLQLLKSFQGHGPHINHLTVQWRLQDEHPAERPIALYYSGNASGPWQQIDGGIKNTGTYTFQLPEHAPTRMYLKVVAYDAAGNSTEQISPTPILVDLARPTARVITIDPIQ